MNENKKFQIGTILNGVQVILLQYEIKMDTSVYVYNIVVLIGRRQYRGDQ